MKKMLHEKFSAPVDAQMWALVISMAPFVFQTAKCLRNMKVLETLKNKEGCDFSHLLEQTGLTEYALSLLLDAGESCGLVFQKDHLFFIAPAGRGIEDDPITKVNMNFSADVCYEGLSFLEESLKTGKPEGLKTFGDWKTIYAGLTELPPKALKSWLEFDHYFSDDAFPKVLSLIFKEQPTRILDIGGNTGKFAIACMLHNPQVSVTLLDHPEQTKLALNNVQEKKLEERFRCLSTNILDHSVPFPKDHDVIWMSQFLDCFGKEDILQIFRRAYQAMNENSYLYIMEPFIDRQRYEASQFCLNMTSLYFACLANGNSRMYRAQDFHDLLHQAGLIVTEEINNIRLSQTILKCKKNCNL